MKVISGGFPGQEQQGGVATTGHAQAAAGLVDVAIDGMLRDPQPAGDFLGMQMFGDEAQTVALTGRQPFNRVRILMSPHRRRGKSPFEVSSIGDCARRAICCALSQGGSGGRGQTRRRWKACIEPTGSPRTETFTVFSATSGEISVNRAMNRGRGPPCPLIGRRKDNR
jgi:hypothetical protein